MMQEALIGFPGVGRKVADCVALFSLDQHGAIPVDVHVCACVRPSVCLSVCLSVLSVCLCLPFFLSFSLSLCVYVCVRPLTSTGPSL